MIVVLLHIYTVTKSFYVTRFRNFDKNIIPRNNQLKMAYICATMGNRSRMLVIFIASLSLFST